MNAPSSQSEFLVISRGQWDAAAAPEAIQKAIDDFYVWLERMVQEGKMKRGERLADQGRTVTRNGILQDGPYGESKEVIGGFWFIRAENLEAAAKIAAQNPCLQFGLFYEIRPLEPIRASAFAVTTETPSKNRRA